ncbi:MAG: hypothetical protein AAGI68_16065 [Planctomycetota bacterium]
MSERWWNWRPKTRREYRVVGTSSGLLLALVVIVFVWWLMMRFDRMNQSAPLAFGGIIFPFGLILGGFYGMLRADRKWWRRYGDGGPYHL